MKTINKSSLLITLLIFISIFFISCGTSEKSTASDLGEDEEILYDTEDESESSDTKAVILSEDEYRNLCRPVTYEDFYGDNTNINVNDFVVYHAFIKEIKRSDSMDIVSWKMFDDKYVFNDNFWITGPEVGTSDSYVGESVDIYFIEGDSIDPTAFKAGQKVTVYGEVVMADEGYIVIPKYIDID